MSHSNIIAGISKQLQEIFDVSEQGIYIYLDDTNKACNGKFATMLGYKSPQEWAMVKENFPTAFVAEKSHQTLIGTFRKAMDKGTGASINVQWKKKSGGTVNTNVLLVPIAFDNHRMALHFVSET